MLKSKKAQEVAKAKFNAFKKVCCEVQKKRGAASRSQILGDSVACLATFVSKFI